MSAKDQNPRPSGRGVVKRLIALTLAATDAQRARAYCWASTTCTLSTFTEEPTQ